MLKIQRVWGPVKSPKPQLLCVETTRDHALHVWYFQFPQLAKILIDRPYFHLFKKETALRVIGSLAVTAAWEVAEQALTQRSWTLPCTPRRRPGRGKMTPCPPRAHLRGRGQLPCFPISPLAPALFHLRVHLTFTFRSISTWMTGDGIKCDFRYVPLQLIPVMPECSSYVN